MLYLLCSLCLCSTQFYYLGNWSLPGSGESLPQNESFQIVISNRSSSSNSTDFNFYVGRTMLRNTTTYYFDLYIHPLLGFSDPVNSSFFFFQFPSYEQHRNRTEVIESSLTNIFVANNVTEFDDLPKLTELVHSYFNDTRILTMNFSFTETNESLEIFMIPCFLKGSLMFNNDIIDISGYLFDIDKYIAEGKIFGVLSAVFALFSIYAWMSMFPINSKTMLSQLSLQTYLLHMSFEFSYSLYLLGLCLQYAKLRSLFLLLFFIYLGLYMTFQMSLISKIWRSDFDMGEIDQRQLRSLFLTLFSQVSFFLFSSLFARIYLFEYPLIPIIILFSPYLPQIIKSAKENTKKNHDTFFIVLTTLNRLCILWYSFVYPASITMVHSLSYACGGTIYLLIQTIIVLLQNKFGGAFFLPKKFRARGYNYSAVPVPPGTECSICMTLIEEGDETMSTPCHHGFHKECLSRWMQEQMICPICRARLPDSDESITNYSNSNVDYNNPGQIYN